jgi:hypothetical protein
MPHTNPWKLAGEEDDTNDHQIDGGNAQNDDVQKDVQINQEEVSLLGPDDQLTIPSNSSEKHTQNSALTFDALQEGIPIKKISSDANAFNTPDIKPSPQPEVPDAQVENEKPPIVVFEETIENPASPIEEKISLSLHGQDEKEKIPQHKKIAIVMASIGGLLFILGIMPFVNDSGLRAEIFGGADNIQSSVDSLITSAIEVQVTPVALSPSAQASYSPSLNEEIKALLQTPTPVVQIPSITLIPTATPTTAPISVIPVEQNKNVGKADPNGIVFGIPENVQQTHSAPGTPVSSVVNVTSASSGNALPPRNSSTGPEDLFLIAFLCIIGVFILRARSLFRNIP